MLDLLEIDLMRIRRMAERANDNALLLYLIDMAILEANRAARSREGASALAANSKMLGEGYSPHVTS